MSQIEKIVVHCSDSSWGSAIEIDKWHKQRGWPMIGYLIVIGNGRPKPDMNTPWIFADGNIEWGRALDDDLVYEPGEIEAHAYGWNRKSVGICLIGKPNANNRTPFTRAQLFKLKNVLDSLKSRFGLEADDVLGHYELDKAKVCPGMDMNIFRRYLRGEITMEFLIQTLK